MLMQAMISFIVRGQSHFLYYQKFHNVIPSREKNWISMASYTVALLKYRKFELNERIRLDVKTLSLILCLYPDADIDTKGITGQRDPTLN